MGRRLEKKTANELGDTAEIDLFETLRASYPEDQIVRVKRGEIGADIRQTVIHRNRQCGLIILDSKNHMSWRNDFAAKLRQDQLAAKADHAILSTTVFPSGNKELCVIDGIIAVSPGRATYIVQILRDAIISLHKQRLSLQQRKTKVEQLYQLITSDGYAKKLAETIRISDEILNLDVEEQKQHQKTWKARGTLATNLKRTLHQIDDDVDGIIAGREVDDSEEGQMIHENEGVQF
jgi:hypothetical protein